MEAQYKLSGAVEVAGGHKLRDKASKEENKHRVVAEVESAEELTGMLACDCEHVHEAPHMEVKMKLSVMAGGDTFVEVDSEEEIRELGEGEASYHVHVHGATYKEAKNKHRGEVGSDTFVKVDSKDELKAEETFTQALMARQTEHKTLGRGKEEHRAKWEEAEGKQTVVSETDRKVKWEKPGASDPLISKSNAIKFFSL